MKHLLLLVFFLLPVHLFAQSPEAEELFRSAKTEFNKEFDKQDYGHAANLLEQAVKLEPDNSKYHYFLGYAYDRLSSKDGRSIVVASPGWASKSSEQFEIVNKLTPKYKDEMLFLDPYSKITSIWGTLAMKYDFCQQPDSAVWALNEGRKRGGFSDFFISTLRGAVNSCAPGSLLFTSGDNFIFPLLYLQKVEKYRTDVTPVVMSLLETEWYPRYLEDQCGLTFGRSKEELDSLSYCYCTDTIFQTDIAKGGSYSQKIATRENSYLYRGDLLFLDLLKNNQFKKEVYLTTGMSVSDMLGLDQDISSLIIINHLNYNGLPEPGLKELETLVKSQFECVKYANPNHSDEVFTISLIRRQVLDRVISFIKKEDFQSAEKLMQLLNKMIPVTAFPIDEYTQNQDQFIWYILKKYLPKETKI